MEGYVIRIDATKEEILEEWNTSAEIMVIKKSKGGSKFTVIR